MIDLPPLSHLELEMRSEDWRSVRLNWRTLQSSSQLGTNRLPSPSLRLDPPRGRVCSDLNKFAFHVSAQPLAFVGLRSVPLPEAGPSGLANAPEDVVVIRHSDGVKEINRRGNIEQWKGQTLTLKMGASSKEIDNEKIIRIETNWSEAYRKGLSLMEVDQFTPAIESFQSALDSEQRPWAKNVIRAKMIECAISIEAFGLAATRFEEVVRHDPQTRFLYLAPMKWTATAGGANLGALAKTWVSTDDPTLQLVGCSWLLTGTTKKQAIEKLEKLTRDFDPKISGLAAAQLWRVRGLTANEKQIGVWIKKLKTLPDNLRAGPWYVVAEAQRRAQLHDQAAINFMRIPILYPEQRSLSAAALYQSSTLMHNAKRPREEAILKNELKESFSDTVWAK